MNTTKSVRRFRSLAAAAAFLLFVTGAASAQLLTTSALDLKVDAELTGTIKDYSAGNTLVLDTLPPNEPVQFKLSKDVRFTDTDGKPIEAAGLTTNRRVRVHYQKINGENIADKISLIKD